MAETARRSRGIPAYEEWLRESGVRFERLEIHEFSRGEGGLSVMARSDVREGDEVIRVPLRLVLCSETVRSLHWSGRLSDDLCASLERACDKWAVVYLFLATERLRGQASTLRSWMSSLPGPGEVGTPVTYPESLLEGLGTTNLHDAVVKIRAKLLALSRCVPEFVAREFGVSLKEEDVVWAYEVFWSRAFSVGGEACLVPLCGMLNHDPASRVTFVTDGKVPDGSFSIVSNMEVAKGSQFFGNYRQRSNEKLLLNYGFVCEDNPLDSFTVKLRAPPPGDELTEMKRRELSSVGWEHYLTADERDPIPQSLIDALSVLCMEPDELYAHREGIALHPAVGLRFRIEALDRLEGLLQVQWERLRFKDFVGDLRRSSSDECREDYPLKCVLLYRAGQAKILKGALEASCRFRVTALSEAACLWSQVSFSPEPNAFPLCTLSLADCNATATSQCIFRGVEFQRCDASGSVRLVTTRRVARGEAILRFPRERLLTKQSLASLASRQELAAVVASWKGDFEPLAALFLLVERESAQPSWLSPFLSMLPTARTSAVFAGDELLESVAGTTLQADTLGKKEEYREEHKRLVRHVLKSAPGPFASSVKEKLATFRNFCWARCSVDQRVVPVESSGGESEVALLPMPFIPRHSPFHRLVREFDSESGCLDMKTATDLEPGAEVFDDCGSQQTQDHILRFGSCISLGDQSNPFDVLSLELGGGEDGEEGDGGQRAALLERLRLPREHFLRPSGGIPRQLLDALRAMSMSEEDASAVGDSLPPCETDDARARALLVQILSPLASHLSEHCEDSVSSRTNFLNPGSDSVSLRSTLSEYRRRQLRIINDAIHR